MAAAKDSKEQDIQQIPSELIPFYEQRVKDLKFLLALQQKKLQQESFKDTSLEELSQNLSDSQKTIEEQSEKLSRADRTISVLQNRLILLSKSTERYLLPNEQMVLPSKKHFDNLVTENARLKRELMYSSYDSAGYEKLRQEIQSWKSKAQEMSLKSSKTAQVNEELRTALKASSDAKDRIVLSLRHELEDFEKNLRIYQIICQSLSGENAKLKKELEGRRDDVTMARRKEVSANTT